MSSQQPWIERRFKFDTPVEQYPLLIDRLRETPACLEELVASVDRELLVRSHEDGWSIQENVGHLGDLEDLMAGRLDDFQAGAEELRPADMSNQATWQAGHNEKKIEDLLRRFRDRREEYVARLESLRPDAFARSAHHGRLGVQMRLVDQLFFQAEHDDHHLARIRQLALGL